MPITTSSRAPTPAGVVAIRIEPGRVAAGLEINMEKKVTEESFLNDRMKKQVAVWLISGICLRGILVDHDDEAIFLLPHKGSAHETQMIYKVVISTIACAA